VKPPLYNARERLVLEAPEAFLLRRRDGIGSQRIESRRVIREGETPSFVWKTIVDLLATHPYKALGISVYAVRTMPDGEHLCAISLKFNPWG
jgi:hypothetical protein